jgi:hypothetical protein
MTAWLESMVMSLLPGIPGDDRKAEWRVTPGSG